MTEKALPKLDWRVVFNRAAPPGSPGVGAGARRAARRDDAGARHRRLGPDAERAADRLHARPTARRRWRPPLWLLQPRPAHSPILRGTRRACAAAEIRSVPRKTLNRAAYHSIFFGLVWGFPARFFFEHASHGQQLALCVMTATMMAGAAFILAPIPAAAAAYVAIMGMAATRMLMTADSLIITAIGPIYTFAMLLMVVSNGRAFMQRKYLDLRSPSARKRSACCCANMKARTPTGCGRPTAKLCFSNVSARFARAIGRPMDELEGLSIIDLLKQMPARRPDRRAAPRRGGGDDRPARRPFSELIVPFPVGDEVRNIELSARPTFNKQGRFIGYHGVGSDVTAARQAADRIAHMARHDALTGLPNRLQLMDNLGAALKSAQARGERMRGAAGRSRPLQDDQRQPRPRRRRPSAAAGVAQLRDGDLRRDDRRPARRRRIRDRRARRSRAGRARAALPRPGQRAAGAVPLSRPAPVRRRQRRRRDRAARRRQRRGDDPQRRSRALPGQGRRGQRHPLLRARLPRPRRGAPQDRAGPAQRDGRGRVQPRLPAGRGRAERADPELRGAAALAQSRARPDSAGQVHPDRRGDRHARADRRMGAAQRLPRMRDLARATSRSRSTSARASCAIRASSSPWFRR